MRNSRILVAGIGNIFFGDDAFGVETVDRLNGLVLPEKVRVVDFGIRSYDLAYAIAEGYEAVILVDATPRGKPPGTLYLIEPVIYGLDGGHPLVNGHSLDLVTVIRMAASLEGPIGKLYLVGCEPAVLENHDGHIGLSAKVSAAIPGAVKLIQTLIAKLISSHENIQSGPNQSSEKGELPYGSHRQSPRHRNPDSRRHARSRREFTRNAALHAHPQNVNLSGKEWK